jgi:hypothetical protein
VSPRIKLLNLLGLSVAYGFGLLIVVGLIPKWGRWYSASPNYRVQADALLHGDLALSHTPLDLSAGMVWSEGGVQQVVGLGIPVLRLPLTILARLFGNSIFPEHLATGLALSFVTFILLTSLVMPVLMRRRSTIPLLVSSLGSAILVLSFPPFVTILKTGFTVLEEAVAHAYLYGILESVLILRCFWKPSKYRWLILMLVAGWGGFIRPPLVFYGFGAWLTVTLVLFWPFKAGLLSSKQQLSPTRFSVGVWALGSFLFFLGIFGLMWTNWMRFGSVAEFGHKLNLLGQSFSGSLYASRFDNPIETEPLPVVTKELLGALFFVKPHHYPTYYELGLFPGQANVARMRAMYFSVYDWSYILPLIGGVAITACWLFVSFRGRLRWLDALLMKMGVWCILSIIPIFWFYLRTPALTSRYLLDFAPGFVVLISVAWCAIVNRLRGGWLMVAVVVLGAWLTWEIASAKCIAGKPISLSWSQLTPRPKDYDHTGTELPELGISTVRSGSSEIPFDGSGWDFDTGTIASHVIVFVQNPEFLELELVRDPEARETPDPKWIRAKIGLEFLRKESITPTQHGWLVRFYGPQRNQYRQGIQVAFIATVPKERLPEEKTSWQLKKVRWRQTEEKS